MWRNAPLDRSDPLDTPENRAIMKEHMIELERQAWRAMTPEQQSKFTDPEAQLDETLAAMRAEAVERRATRDGREGESQHIPKVSGFPFVHDVVIEEMTELMRARKAIGTERYGTPLQPFNTRDQGMDAFEELGDALVYLRALMYEHRYMLETIRMALPIIDAAAPRSDIDVPVLRGRFYQCDTIQLKDRPADTDG